MANTQTATALPFRVPSGTEIYDALMAKIEPELVMANIPHLDEKYAGETADERAARYERYRQAYDKYDEAFEQWITQLRSAVHVFRTDALRSAETQDKEKEQNAMSQLESQFQKS